MVYKETATSALDQRSEGASGDAVDHRTCEDGTGAAQERRARTAPGMGGGVLAHSSPRIPGGADLGDDDDAGGLRFRAAMRRPRQERARGRFLLGRADHPQRSFCFQFLFFLTKSKTAITITELPHAKPTKLFPRLMVPSDQM